MSAAVCEYKVWTSEIEEVAVWVTGIDAKVPVASVPREWAIEVGCIHVSPILPIEQYVAKVKVALLPIESVEIVHVVDTHEIVEVDFIGSLILLVGEVELVCHLVGQE